MSTRGFHSSVLIDRPVDEVWAFLTKWEDMPRWMKGVDSMRPLGDGPIGTGTELRFVARGAEHPSTITAWAPPKQLTLSSTQGGITATYHYRCEKEKDGTRLTLNAQCTANSGLWRLAHPLIGYLMKRSDSDQPARFKQALIRAIMSRAERALDILRQLSERVHTIPPPLWAARDKVGPGV